MNKTKAAVLMPLLAVFSSAYAGDMGPVAVSTPLIPFASIEGSYTWNSENGIFINNTESSQTRNGWGGRVAGGIEYELTNNLGLTGELGWGYYGKVSNYLAFFNSNASIDIYGIDLLAGIDYTFNQFDFFAKAGAMFENVIVKNYQNLGLTFPGSAIAPQRSTSSLNGTIPEVKAGAIYNVNDRLGISLAYMYASGYSLKSSSHISASSNGIIVISDFNQSGPLSLSSIMLGLRYNFA